MAQHYSMWRGVAGLVKPTRRPGSLETLIRLLPEGIGVVPLLLDVRAGSHAEFSSAIPHYEKHVAELAEQGMDMIHPGGTPPFMLQGYKGEDKLIRSWEKKYKTPIFTSGRTTCMPCARSASRSSSARAIRRCRTRS